MATEKDKKTLAIPECGVFAADDPEVTKRKSLAEKLKRGQRVNVAPSGELIDPNSPEAKDQDGKTLNVPDGKLAAAPFYWYEKDPKLLETEKKLMRDSFPQFSLGKFEVDENGRPDGRLYWEGVMKPCGENELHWTLLAVYDNDHPHNRDWGGSVRVYSIDPNLDDLTDEIGRELPHVLKDDKRRRYMCTARMSDVASGNFTITSASMSLRWALKWTFTVTMWLNGELGNEIFNHDYF